MLESPLLLPRLWMRVVEGKEERHSTSSLPPPSWERCEGLVGMEEERELTQRQFYLCRHHCRGCWSMLEDVEPLPAKKLSKEEEKPTPPYSVVVVSTGAPLLFGRNK